MYHFSGSSHLCLPVSDGKNQDGRTRKWRCSSKWALAPAAPARVRLAGSGGLCICKRSPGASCVLEWGCVSTASHRPPLKNHSVTGEPCAHDPFTAHFHVIPRKGTWIQKLSGLNESLDAPRSSPSATSATNTLPIPAAPSCCVILPCTIWAPLRANPEHSPPFFHLTPLAYSALSFFSSPSCGPAQGIIL